MNDATFRTLTENEVLVLRKLAELDFKGRDEMLEQLEGLRAKAVGDGFVELEVRSKSLLPIKSGVLVEAVCRDSADQDDSTPDINIILHVRDWKLAIFEFYKEDGDITGEINPDRFTFWFSQFEANWPPV